jgi:hypothetical protein
MCVYLTNTELAVIKYVMVDVMPDAARQSSGAKFSFLAFLQSLH